uniref:Uncharacterized protein n=1 Tax=Arundo donax TaxID=35708 RepID=A0A0A8YVD6_ARUDO
MDWDQKSSTIQGVLRSLTNHQLLKILP